MSRKIRLNVFGTVKNPESQLVPTKRKKKKLEKKKMGGR
jgi:hypothetical protein